MLLKLKLTPAIYLVGFMGSGKSTVGAALADELGWKFYDLDQEIEKGSGTSISNLFDEQGEARFRELETQALEERIKSVCLGRPQVISLGGGAFTQDHICKMANDHGVTIWLDAPFEVIEQRIASETHRPLARDPQKLRELYEKRREAYARADFRIDTDSLDPAAVVAQILALPIFVP